jgi:tetratricopeptide (TPR) repeat protein
MRHNLLASVTIATAALVTGCNAGGLTPNQKSQANQQWNDARANVLESLASDQYKDGSLDKCQTTLAQALRLAPDHVSLHLLAAKVLIEQNHLELAQQQLADAHRLDRKNAEAEYLQGVVFQHWQQFEKARLAYADAVKDDPTELSYVLAQAEMRVAEGQPSAALELLQSKAMVFEHSGVIRDAIGQLLIQQNRHAEGIAELREACLLLGDEPTLREHLAFALLANNQFTEAGDCFQMLAKEPDYQKRADVRAALAKCQSQSHQYAEARSNYLAATQLNPSCCGYWLGLAKTAIELSDLTGAEQASRRAIEVDPTSSAARCLMGFVNLRQNRLPEALTAFRAAIDADPFDSVSVCMAGYVLSKSGQPLEAKELYARALRLDPKSKLAASLSDAMAAAQ